MAGRRERLRAETIRDIKAAALGRLREDGDVSLRAVARDIGMSAPGLYRYYDSREDLLTALISDGYHDLADALESALGLENTRPAAGVDGGPADGVEPTAAAPFSAADRATADGRPPLERLLVVSRAYRAWSVEHPNVFGLLYGDPLPGYAAPEGGVTVTANRRVGRALLQPFFEAALSGQLVVPERWTDAVDTPQMKAFVAELEAMVGAPVPAALAPFALAVWGRLHGLVSLEVFGQYHWVYPEGAVSLFEADLAALVTELTGGAGA